MVASTMGAMAPPQKPCRARKTIIDSISQAAAQPMLAAEKPSEHMVNRPRVENSRDSQPESGIMMTSAISAAVSTQLTSSGLAARPARISANELPTIWILSTARNMPSAMPTKASSSPAPSRRESRRAAASVSVGAPVMSPQSGLLSCF